MKRCINIWDHPERFWFSFFSFFNKFCSPFVKGSRSFLGQHGEGTVDGTVVLAYSGVHEAGLYHIHRRGYDGGAEPGSKRSREVAGQVICGRTKIYICQNQELLSRVIQTSVWYFSRLFTCHEIVLEYKLFDDVIGYQLSTVHNSISCDVWYATWNNLCYTIILLWHQTLPF